MNSYSFSLAERLIPATYLQQAASAKKSRENLIRQLIEQVKYALKMLVAFICNNKFLQC
jgi:O-phospho-L-seryl-tRNASec:L-selenocysteinyl-tRNA synthase